MNFELRSAVRTREEARTAGDLERRAAVIASNANDLGVWLVHIADAELSTRLTTADQL